MYRDGSLGGTISALIRAYKHSGLRMAGGVRAVHVVVAVSLALHGSHAGHSCGEPGLSEKPIEVHLLPIFLFLVLRSATTRGE